MSEATENREPLGLLPIKRSIKNQYREKVLNKYAALLWRHTTKETIVPILETLYEQAYSKGLSDMDKMHNKIK